MLPKSCCAVSDCVIWCYDTRLYTVVLQIMRMVCRDTVEEKLIALQARKRRMSQQALGGSAGGGADKGSTEEGGGANKLSLEELKGLFL